MRLRNLQNGSRFRDVLQGNVDACFLHAVNCMPEQGKLFMNKALVCLVRRRKMGKHALELKRRKRHDFLRQSNSLLRAHSNAPHSRLHLQMDPGTLSPAHSFF